MKPSEVLIPVDLERRFGSLARLYGVTGAHRIRESHIVVVGLGGVGSWIAEAAARSGVAKLTLIDFDHIAESNVNRQVHAVSDTLGQAKVLAMRDRIAEINPECEVSCVEEFVDVTNWPAVAALGNSFEFGQLAVIDACDQVRAKVAMATWAIAQKVIFLSVGAAGGKRLAHRVDIEDISQVTHDPLLAQLRYRLRKEHGATRQGKMGVACVFSREPVLQPADLNSTSDVSNNNFEDVSKTQLDSVGQNDGSLNCHGYGSAVSVTATFGFCAAGWVLNKIAE